MTDLLILNEVKKAFGGVTAVDGLSFAARRGLITGLMGPNGAGKTTIINLISGIMHPDEGEIVFADTSITRSKPHAISALGLARTYQNVRLIPGLTALEQVVAGSFVRRGVPMWASVLGTPAARRAMKETRQRARRLLDRVGMGDAADVLAETLSYGEQRRIEIARALGAEPNLILMDEPTAGMNPAEATEIGRLIQKLRDEGLTLVVVEHNMKLVVDFCDEVVVMNFGRLITKGAPQDCIRNPDVQEAYFGKPRHAEGH